MVYSKLNLQFWIGPGVCLCVYVSLFITSEISWKGFYRATLLSLKWRALGGKLHKLLLNLIWRVVWENKPLVLFWMYSINCYSRPPLAAAKTVLNSRWSVKRGLLRLAHAKSTLLFSSNSKWKAFSEQSQCTYSCIHWFITREAIRWKAPQTCYIV